MYRKDKAVDRMNAFGKEHRPFFFMTDFLLQENLVLPLDEVDSREIQLETESISIKDSGMESSAKGSWMVRNDYSKSVYCDQFERVVSEIKKGNSFLINLTCETPVAFSGSLRQIFQRAEAKYKLWYRDRFVVFSPETFVQIKGGKIFSYPMKGTIDASLPNAREKILDNLKEKAEHCTIVDLIRNDLSMVARNVCVDRFRYIDELKTDRGALLQVSSQISGDLPEDYLSRIGEIVYQLLPAGSVTGAPKNKTVEIIRRVETYSRGFYTGIFGIFDGQSLDSAVMIRFIEKTDSGLVYKSGGGITAFSNLEDEYNEMKNKVYVPFG